MGDKPPLKKKGTLAKKKTKSPLKLDAAIGEANTIVKSEVVDDAPIEELEIPNVSDGHLGLEICDHPFGVMVLSADPQDLGYESGLREGDVILSLNGMRVTTHQAAAAIMFAANSQPSSNEVQPVIRFYAHNSSATPLKIELHRAAAAEKALHKRRQLTKFVALDTSEGYVGLSCGNHPLGLLVLDVVEADLAYKAGLRSHDVIVTLNGCAAVDHRAAVEEIRRSEGEVINLTFYSAKAASVELVLANSSFGKYTGSTSITTHTSRAERPPRKPASQRDETDAKEVRTAADCMSTEGDWAIPPAARATRWNAHAPPLPSPPAHLVAGLPAPLAMSGTDFIHLVHPLDVSSGERVAAVLCSL